MCKGESGLQDPRSEPRQQSLSGGAGLQEGVRDMGLRWGVCLA